MNQHEMQAAAEFRAHEMAIDTPSDRAWGRWLDAVVAKCRASGLTVRDDLDGDGAADGYSLDQAYDWYLARWSVERATAAVIAGIQSAGA